MARNLTYRVVLFCCFAFCSPELRGQCLSGNYTIGTGGHYSTLTQAINALKQNGMCGSVKFSLKDGTYTELFTVTSIPGASAAFNLRITSLSQDSSKVVITVPSTSYNEGIIFQNIDNVQVDHLTFFNPGATGVSTLNILNGNNFKVTSNVFKGSVGNYPYAFQAGNWTGGTVTGGLAQNNSSTWAYMGFQLRNVNNLKLINNYIFKSKFGFSLFNNQSSIISHNTIVSIDPINTDICGISTQGNFSNTIFDGNEVQFDNCTQCRPLQILFGTAGLNNKALFRNNIFNVASNQNFYCAIFTQVSNFSFYNNVFNLGDKNEAAGNNSNATILADSPSTGIEFYNNIVSSFAHCRALDWRISGANFQSDHNNFYTNGTQLAVVNSQLAVDLSIWQSNTGQDANSFQTEPGYFAENNFRIIRNATLDNQGLPSAWVTFDIDSVLRSSTPDIGVNEFTANNNHRDIGISFDQNYRAHTCYGLHQIPISIKNWGDQVIEKVTFEVHVNGVSQNPSIWIGSLQPGAISTFSLNSIQFLEGVYPIKIVAKLDASDQNVLDNTLTLNLNIPEKPIINTNKPPSICRTDSVLVTSIGNHISWSTGATLPTLVVKNQGDYWYDRTDLNGCISRSDIISVLVNENIPNINFDIEQTEYSIEVTNHSTNALSYLWRLGDGKEKTDYSFNHGYRLPGNYLLELFATNNRCQVYSKRHLTIQENIEVECQMNDYDYVHTLEQGIGSVLAGGQTYGSPGAFVVNLNLSDLTEQWRWDYSISDDELVTDLEVDRHQNVYAAIRADFHYAVLAKLDKRGQQKFTRVFSNGLSEFSVPKVQVNSSINSVFFMGVDVINSFPYHIQKFDTLGNLIWRSRLPSGTTDWDFATYNPLDMVADQAGQVFVLMFGYRNNVPDFILVKYNQAGIVDWQLKLNKNTDSKQNAGLELDSDGNIYAFGNSAGRPFVCKVSAAGTLIWQYVHSNPLSGLDFGVDKYNNVYFVSFLQFDAVLSKLSRTGELLYSKQLPYEWSSEKGSLSFDKFGNVYCTSSHYYSKFNQDGLLLSAYNFAPNTKASLVLNNGNVILGGSQYNGCALKRIEQITDIPYLELTAQPESICAGGSIIFSGNVFYTSNNYTVTWYKNSNVIQGESDLSATIDAEPGDQIYFQIILNDTGCSSNCSFISQVIAPIVLNPKIEISGQDQSLISSEAANYQWFLDDAVLDGETTQTLLPKVSGVYHVQGTVNGCTVISNSIQVTITEVENPNQNFVYPNPAKGTVNILLPERSAEYSYAILSLTSGALQEGKVENGQNQIDIKSLSAGTYLLILKDPLGKVIRHKIIIHQ